MFCRSMKSQVYTPNYCSLEHLHIQRTIRVANTCTLPCYAVTPEALKRAPRHATYDAVAHRSGTETSSIEHRIYLPLVCLVVGNVRLASPMSTCILRATRQIKRVPYAQREFIHNQKCTMSQRLTSGPTALSEEVHVIKASCMTGLTVYRIAGRQIEDHAAKCSTHMSRWGPRHSLRACITTASQTHPLPIIISVTLARQAAKDDVHATLYDEQGCVRACLCTCFDVGSSPGHDGP
jgi:hypothetical protein